VAQPGRRGAHGAPAHQLVGYSFAVLFPAESRSRLARRFARHHLKGTPEFDCEVPLLTGTGEPHWVGVRVRQLQAANGRPCYVCAAHDLQAITARCRPSSARCAS